MRPANALKAARRLVQRRTWELQYAAQARAAGEIEAGERDEYDMRFTEAMRELREAERVAAIAGESADEARMVPRPMAVVIPMRWAK